MYYEYLIDKFQLNPRPHYEKMLDKVYAESVLTGSMQPIIAKLLQVDSLLCMGIIKAMPAFARLAPADKV